MKDYPNLGITIVNDTKLTTSIFIPNYIKKNDNIKKIYKNDIELKYTKYNNIHKEFILLKLIKQILSIFFNIIAFIT